MYAEDGATVLPFGLLSEASAIASSTPVSTSMTTGIFFDDVTGTASLA